MKTELEENWDDDKFKIPKPKRESLSFYKTYTFSCLLYINCQISWGFGPLISTSKYDLKWTQPEPTDVSLFHPFDNGSSANRGAVLYRDKGDPIW